MSKQFSTFCLIVGIMLLALGLNGLNSAALVDPLALLPAGVTEKGMVLIILGMTAIAGGSAILLLRPRN